ncbi:GerMN domain-containing protein [Phycicoccus sp. MAQZ13P-2]|uniref:GerMN domain-containing protein n=1 Tax=Phycicoccus mangrovi TaxID=2840470 RepID=UPI001C00671A|nr:GerMN domain-containing protein [Phycicoccus mangrovi]MBT9255897.1 GerMN domain-containing protein [Phycicoccus mangrovi]MBT9274491.1 GerMN domain-containing protein [Phycicoccus mangrovi]
MRSTRLLAVLVAALLLAGCSGLSGGGPVQPGLDVSAPIAPQIGLVYPGPDARADQDREAIVSGFLRAGASSDGKYDNARKFLTSRMAERWQPDETLVLLSGSESPTTRLLDPATVQVTAPVAGTVDADGRYTAAEPGSSTSARFSLTSVGGRWRIDGMPEGFGRWIADDDVPRLVQPFAVHYVSTSHRATVPDVRWFPLDRLLTRLANAQLAPVPDHLLGAATTAVPAGARLLGDAVSVDASGVVSVNLIASRLAPGETTRENIWAQFLTTLTQDPTVTAVTLQIDGVPVDLDGVEGPVSSLERIGFPLESETAAVPPVVRRGATVAVFDPTGSVREKGATGGARTYPDVPADFTHLALSADGAETAAVDPSGDGLSRWRGTNRYEVPPFGTDVGAPAYDRRGFLWAGAVGSDGARLFTVDTRVSPADLVAARAQPVQAPWLAGRRVLEARVATDGDRVVVLSSRPDGSAVRLDLAGVVRGGGQRPERLSAPLRLGAWITRATGLTWVDAQQVATIASVDGAPARPVLVSVDAAVSTLPEAGGARAVAATAGERGLYLVTREDRLLSRSGLRWVDSGEATDLATPAG